MLKCRWFWFGVALLGALGLVLFLVISTPQDPISLRNYDKIKNGMTKEEVQTILGGPGTKVGGDGRLWHHNVKIDDDEIKYTELIITNGRSSTKLTNYYNMLRTSTNFAYYYGKWYSTTVIYDARDCVQIKSLHKVSGEPSLLERIRTWLGW
jgi:hypothetical protein